MVARRRRDCASFSPLKSAQSRRCVRVVYQALQHVSAPTSPQGGTGTLNFVDPKAAPDNRA
ncbi:hypothetical protein BD779DRAFT_1578315, partial [Infundibulicybe gibba]